MIVWLCKKYYYYYDHLKTNRALTLQSSVVVTQLDTDCSSFYLRQRMEARVKLVCSRDRTRTSCTHERTCVRVANALTNWASQADRQTEAWWCHLYRVNFCLRCVLQVFKLHLQSTNGFAKKVCDRKGHLSMQFDHHQCSICYPYVSSLDGSIAAIATLETSPVLRYWRGFLLLVE